MMRRVLLLAAVAAVVVALLVGTVLWQALTPQASADESTCQATLGPSTGTGDGARDAAALDPEQRSIVAKIVDTGRARGIAPRGWQIAIQAGKTESDLRNLDHGHASSVGVFQIIQMHGTLAQRMDLDWQMDWFWDHLERVDGWQTMRPGDAAQAVERSAFPDRYHRWEAMAAHLVGEVAAGNFDPTGCARFSGNASAAAATAIAFAHEQLGEPYVWGATGPGSWDCSGLMLRSYQAAGITLPRVSRQQYGAGARIPREQAQPGDLLFWATNQADPTSIHHVAMYLGDNKIIEAQQSGVPVHIRAVKWTEGELMPTVTRPGT